MTKPRSKTENRIYLTFNYPVDGPYSGKTLLTGIRKKGKIYYITGWYIPVEGETISFLYTGDVTGRLSECSSNAYHILNYPSSPGNTVISTNLYGPNVLSCNASNVIVRVVGNYFIAEQSGALGCMYEGPLDGSGTWITLKPAPNVTNTIAHSTHGDLVVGNYNTNLTPFSQAFIYNVKTQTYQNVTREGVINITAYGIWHNGGNHYTIAGGITDLDIGSGLGAAYLVNWSSSTCQLTGWQEYHYGNDKERALITHFNGITSDEKGGYYLTGDSDIVIGNSDPLEIKTIAFFTHITRDKNGCLDTNPCWSEISFSPGNYITSGNSIVNKTVIGVYTEDPMGTVNGYISLA